MISRSKSAMAGSAGFPGAVTNQPLPGLPIRPSRQSSSERCGTPAAGRSDPKAITTLRRIVAKGGLRNKLTAKAAARPPQVGCGHHAQANGSPQPLPWREPVSEAEESDELAQRATEVISDAWTLCEVVMAAGGMLAVGWFVTHDLGAVLRWAGGIVR